MPIPFLDLVTPHKELEEELLDVVRKALRSAHFIGGEEVDSFEKEYADFCETEYAIGVGSGTDALRLALIAAGIGEGDTVVTVPNTFIATTEAISQAGAQVAFVDIDEQTYNMDPAKLEEYLDSHPPVKAVIPVHLYGQMCDMDAILDLAERYNFLVIEDACQAHGAQYYSSKKDRWFKAGSLGTAAAFSFYPGKNLGACGEGGAVTTNDPEIAQRVRMLRDHGQAKKYYHDTEGYNGRLDAIQAGFLRIKLRHLPAWNENRRAAAERYSRLLSEIPGIVIPNEQEWSRAVYHLYVIRSKYRAELQEYLADQKIGSALHYPVPLHLQNAYVSLSNKQGSFPITEKVVNEILSLPMFPQLNKKMQEHVYSIIKEHVTAIASV